MIKFTEGGLEDIWPQKTPRIQAISYAMQQAMKMVKKYADKSRCYAAVDELSEEILDYFAVEMRSMYYSQGLPISKKREIVKNTLKWYTYAGTAATVADMVSAVFGNGRVIEWLIMMNHHTPQEHLTLRHLEDSQVRLLIRSMH